MQVILVHGIWMKGLEMAVLRKAIAGQGYKTYLFSYWSIFRTVEDNADKLFKKIEKMPSDCVIIAHSLGGIVVRTMFARHAAQLSHVRGVVSLGSPLNGSQTARFMAERRWLRWGLGASRQALCQGVSAWDQDIPWLSIAGTHSVGVGSYLGALPSQGDGTVTEQETELEGVQMLAQYPVSHTGMLFSTEVVEAALEFIRNIR